MYKLVLILKYLRRKLAPMFAALAVLLCTMMVIIVISVMGGFLHLLQDSARKLTGDVTVTAYSLQGFAHYEDLLQRLDQLPEVAVATPVIRSFGLLNLSGHTLGVQIVGIHPQAFDQIVAYRDTLVWTTRDKLDEIDRRFGENDLQNPTLREIRDEQRATWESIDLTELGMTLRPPGAAIATPDENPSEENPSGGRGMVIGIEVNPYQFRNKTGEYNIRDAAIGAEAKIMTFPVTQAGNLGDISPSYRGFTVVNEFKSGLYDVDANVVFVPFDALQNMLEMQPKETYPEYDPITGEPIGEPVLQSGKTSEIVIAGAPGYTLQQVRGAVATVVDAWVADHRDVRPPAVLTWEEVHATLLSAVKNETGLVTFLFAMISLVAVVMVATTFYMIVLEKTRDIGVLRAIGASRVGILGLFVGYGLAIGVLGSALGATAAWLIVTHLNDIQSYMGSYLGVTVHLLGAAIVGVLLGALAAVLIGFVQQRMRYWLARLIPAVGLLLFLPALAALFVFPDLTAWLNGTIRFVMWDPQTYMFDRIPDEVNPVTASIIVLGAIVSSVVGAVIPALIASSLEPVEALRYE